MTFTRDTLESGGQVGRDLLAVDWEATPLGHPDRWPASLRNAVRILLTSRFSMWMAWGPDLTFLCNEAYRRDTLGKKYPWALGKPASLVWSEIWDDIGPRIEHVMTTGEATWDESLRLFLERSGYVEETYHTFSYSPLADDDGDITGMLCVVKEDTEQVIAARRMTTLRDLGDHSGGLSEAASIREACGILRENPWSLPFTLLYLFDETGSARLAGSTGFAGPHPAAPETIAADEPDPGWPAAEALACRTVLVQDLRSRYDDLPTGGWDEPPRCALVVPLLQPGQTTPYGFLVVGANPYLEIDDAYEGFVHLIAGHLASTITDARAFEFERQRAEGLAALDRAKTDFFTNVSHEFRTPLTLLLGPAQDALADDTEVLPPRQRERLQVIERNAQRLLKLVNSLLDFSRLESGRVTGQFEPVDLATYTRELASMFESAASRAGLTLGIDCPPLPQPVHVDQEHWAKIVLNLLSNALKFTLDGGITVSLEARDDAVVLRVGDTGSGIPEAELPHLFERFHRIPGTPARTHEGSGIGLALVAELAALHGGDVTVTSEPGRGSTFAVRIPFGSGHLPPEQVRPGGGTRDATAEARGFVAEAMRWLTDDEGPADASHPASSTAATADGGPRVLVVDDNADMREYVAGLLARHYRVETAVDGIDALAVVERFVPDLVITDVMMPRLDGFGLLQRLHADPRTLGVPVIMLSARAGEEGTVEGLEAGADDYLVKPFSARELLARVRVNLELDRAHRVQRTLVHSQQLLDQAQRMAKVGSWEIDPDTGAVRGSDELLRILEVDRHGLATLDYARILGELVHPDDRQKVDAQIRRPDPGAGVRYEARLRTSSGAEKLVQVRGELVTDESGHRVLRGSVQDITEQRALERAVAQAAAREQVAAREHAIADELQRRLLPRDRYELDRLDVATYYRSGVEGTQVGGDWFDVVELGVGRVALVVGDVMGRGIPAASVMGQVRSALRAMVRLDLDPGQVVEQLDGFVRDLDGDQIVTCVLAVLDPTDHALHYANAGHVPPVLGAAEGTAVRLDATAPPLGTGGVSAVVRRLELPPGAQLTLFTDGLVEHRGESLDRGLDALARLLATVDGMPLAGVPQHLVDTLLPEGPDDDVALLVARVTDGARARTVTVRLGDRLPVIARAREQVATTLEGWGVPAEVTEDLKVMASELVTNALVHGEPPLDVRLTHLGSEIVLEVDDRSPARPHRVAADRESEHGRGLQIVATLADRWGTRTTGAGKTVWCSRTLPAAAGT